MIRRHSAIVFLVFCFVFSSCANVPLTGRSQIDLVPAETMLSMSYQQYGDVLKSSKLSTDQARVQMVRRVAERLQKAVERYMTDNALLYRLDNYRWEFTLIESDELNAWCLPGGKVGVYTGILKVARDEQGLAVVLAHEIAHAIARHGNERMSQGLMLNLGEHALSTALQKKPEATRQLWSSVFNVGTKYGVLLPYSRLHESEADHLGLVFMAMAGYDPRAAVVFWERMAALKDGGSSPAFLSTHPSDQARIQNIRARIPEAMQYLSK
jgi:predicted Zn-dependent protease